MEKKKLDVQELVAQYKERYFGPMPHIYNNNSGIYEEKVRLSILGVGYCALSLMQLIDEQNDLIREQNSLLKEQIALQKQNKNSEQEKQY